MEWYRDGVLLGGSRDSSPPYTLLLDLATEPIGDEIVIRAKAVDSSGGFSFSDPITLIHKWQLIINDPDEPHARDIKEVYARSTSSTLEFRVVTNGNWTNYKDTLNGIDVAIYLDLDLSAATGDRSTENGGIVHFINDIGAEMLAVIGTHGDTLREWTSAGGGGWVLKHGPAGFARRVIPADTNVFEVAVFRNQIPGNPPIVDVVVANVLLISGISNPDIYDWAPETGHARFFVSGNFIGSPALPLSEAAAEAEDRIPIVHPRNPYQ
jgi:hypothetical protein